MQIYTAPLRDMRFVLNELHQDDGFGNLPGQEDFTPDLTDAVLEGAAQFCEEVLLPLNRSGDEEGCHLENGVVRTPAGFIDAYRQFAEGGWSALVTPTQWGGRLTLRGNRRGKAMSQTRLNGLARPSPFGSSTSACEERAFMVARSGTRAD